MGVENTGLADTEINEKKVRYSLVFSFIIRILVVLINDMRDKLKISVGIVGLVLVVLALPLAIKFFFRGFLLLLENPLEGMAFSALFWGGLSFLLHIEDLEKAK